MRVAFADEDAQEPELVFPPVEDYLDLRENPRAVEQIAAARRLLPLRNFLVSLNDPASPFITAGSEVKAANPRGEVHEFASHTSLVFLDPSLNFDREVFADLRSGLKEHLERNSEETVRAELRISKCNFHVQNGRGFCLGIGLWAQGDSAEKAEFRWGLALTRVQQALLFRARTIRQRLKE